MTARRCARHHDPVGVDVVFVGMIEKPFRGLQRVNDRRRGGVLYEDEIRSETAIWLSEVMVDKSHDDSTIQHYLDTVGDWRLQLHPNFTTHRAGPAGPGQIKSFFYNAGQMASLIEQSLCRHGYSLMLCNSGEDEQLEKQYLRAGGFSEQDMTQWRESRVGKQEAGGQAP
jgi:hypothetical protein